MRGSRAPSAPAGAPPRTVVPRHAAAPALKARQGTARYVTSIDGLRAFAVLAVVAYHLGLPFAQGGLLGVTVFFVISGYLITGLLAAEFARSGAIDLPRFWLRRVRRLAPAIVTVILVMAALFSFLSPVLLTKMRPDIIPGLLWFTNWWYILRDISYFDALGSPSPLTHFWSLAIEEQFYLVWPLLLIGAYRLGASNRTVRRICLLLAAASAGAMALLHSPGADPSRIYYGTDTRAFSLLIGAWLSYVWPISGAKFDDEDIEPTRRVLALDAAGALSFGLLLLMCLGVSGFSDFMYRGGLLAASVLAAVVIAALVHPMSTLAPAFEWGPAVWIGQRSYGMYLWHYPLILLLGEVFGVHSGAYPWWFCLLAVGAVVLVSHVSLTLVEDPIRHGALGRWLAGVRRGRIDPLAWTRRHLPQAVAATAICCIGVAGIIAVPDAFEVPHEAIRSTGQSADQARKVDAAGLAAGVRDGGAASEGRNGSVRTSGKDDAARAAGAGADGSDPDGTGPDGTAPADSQASKDRGAQASASSSPSPQRPVLPGFSPMFIADSVPGDTEAVFKAAFPGGMLDSYVGRQPYQVPQVLKGYLAQNAVGNVVIVACFNNGLVTEANLQAMADAIGPDRDLFFVNVQAAWGADRQFMAPNNALLASFAEARENVHVVDWAGLSTGHEREWLYRDGEHLRPTAHQIYIDNIANAVAADAPTAG